MKKILSAVVAVVVLIVIGIAIFGGKLDWPNGKLGSMIPQIKGAKGEVHYEKIDALYITLEDISEKEHLNYIEKCKDKGFFVESEEKAGSFKAFNKDGYKLDISYYSDKSMAIRLDAPIEMSTFIWPTSNIAKLLPKPDSNYGKISWQAEYGFVIYVGNTTKEEYINYVSEVESIGFTSNYSKGDNYYNAKNSEGYSVSLRYEGFNTMFVRIDEPKEEAGTSSGNNNSNNGNSGNNNGSSSGELVNGMRPEFKEAMDSYEAFFNEYCEFMKRYNSSTNPTSMLNDYMSFLNRYTEAMSKLDEISNGEMNNAELLYYTQTVARINQKLLELNQ